MGEIRTRVTLENRDDRGAVRLGLRGEANVRRTTVEGVVDTGAVSLVIPEEIATRSWGSGTEGTRTVVYADERREERPVTERHDRDRKPRHMRTEAIIGPAGSQVLIGQVVLEVLDLDRRLQKPHAGAAPPGRASPGHPLSPSPRQEERRASPVYSPTSRKQFHFRHPAATPKSDETQPRAGTPGSPRPRA